MDEELLKDDNVNETVDTKDDTNESDNYLTEFKSEQLQGLLKQVGQVVKMMEDSWKVSKNEFQLTEEMTQKLYAFNQKHAEPMPEDLSDEEKEKFDKFNGLDKLTDKDLESIFPDDSPIYGVTMDVTIDRIKDCMGDLIGWLSALKEYRGIHDAYMQLIELEEEKEIEKLKIITEAENDEEKKKQYQSIIDAYYKRTQLGFLKDITKEDIERITRTFHDDKKIEYWIRRSIDKLRRLGISSKCILELSQFEKRFLEEKYHKQNNILLVYFLMKTTYCDVDNKKDPDRGNVLAMTIILDSVIRKNIPDDKLKIVMNNIIEYENIFLDKLNEK